MPNKIQIDRNDLYARLKRPHGRVDVVLDTDTYNEIDDQFAIAYMLLSSDKINVKGIFAAPCINDKSVSVADGMEKSYQEILRVLRVMERGDLESLVCRGSEVFLPSETEPVNSEAALRLIEISKSYTKDRPLYVAAIGAITNIASAILLDPTIVERIYILWLGGNFFDIGHTKEYNLMQDVAAGRVVLQSGAPVALLPAQGGTSHLITTKPELEFWLKGKNPLCDFLLDLTVKYCEHYFRDTAWSKVIWDIAAVAWLINDTYCEDRVITAPIFEYDHHYGEDPDGLPIRYVYYWNRDAIFSDLFKKLTEYSPEA